MRAKKRIYILLIFSFVLNGCKEKPEKLERQALISFLKYDPNKKLNRKEIQELLFDIQSSTSTLGRAVQITKNLFLTNHHVINRILPGYNDIRLIKQSQRGEFKNKSGKFEIVHVDKIKDLALLKLIDQAPIGEAYLHLYKEIPKTGDKVSEFIGLIGDTVEHTGYKLDYGGKDVYDREKHIEHAGTFILPPNSTLFEKKGFVLEFKPKKVAALTKNLPSKIENEMLSTIAIYQGESGSPIFLELGEDDFYMVGVSTKALNMNEMIPTPGHPLGFMAYARTVSFAVHRDAIHKFLSLYISKLEKSYSDSN